MSSVIDIPWAWRHLIKDTLCRPGQGALHTIVLNQLDTKGAVEVFDGLDATGLMIATIWTDFDQPACLMFDSKYKTGLFIAIAGDWDLTVTYI